MFNEGYLRLKKFFISLCLLIIALSVGICVLKPTMHKPISLNIIEYAIKFNTNGEMQTIKTTTTYEHEER